MMEVVVVYKSDTNASLGISNFDSMIYNTVLDLLCNDSTRYPVLNLYRMK